jgi:hypothetical protein
MTNHENFDRDTLYNHIYFVLEKELGESVQVDYLTDRICDEVIDWVPKKGDFWLTEDGDLYVNKGWEAVGAEAQE